MGTGETPHRQPLFAHTEGERVREREDVEDGG